MQAEINALLACSQMLAKTICKVNKCPAVMNEGFCEIWKCVTPTTISYISYSRQFIRFYLVTFLRTTIFYSSIINLSKCVGVYRRHEAGLAILDISFKVVHFKLWNIYCDNFYSKNSTANSLIYYNFNLVRSSNQENLRSKA